MTFNEVTFNSKAAEYIITKCGGSFDAVVILSRLSEIQLQQGNMPIDFSGADSIKAYAKAEFPYMTNQSIIWSIKYLNDHGFIQFLNTDGKVYVTTLGHNVSNGHI